MSKLHLFQPMSLAEWFAAYKPCIRTNVDWDALWKVRPVPRLRLLSHHDDVVLYHPWYRSGHWRHGSPQKAYRVARGRRHALLRCPAVAYRGRFLALDGNHRVLNARTARLFTDCFAKGWLT